MYLLSITLILTLLTACHSNSASPYRASDLASHQVKESYISVEGLYSNYDYGYSVSVPSKVIGCRDKPPAPNHGFGVDLTEKSCRWMERARDGIYPSSYISLEASYNSLEWKSPDDAIEAHLSYLKSVGAKGISIVQRDSTKLSDLPATRFVVQYDASGVRKIEELIFAFRKEESTHIVYTMDLVSSVLGFDLDKKVLDELQQNWKFQPLPK